MTRLWARIQRRQKKDEVHIDSHAKTALGIGYEYVTTREKSILAYWNIFDAVLTTDDM